MSDLLTTYTTFSAIDYKGQNVLSSYSLSATPFVFVPDLPQTTSNKVLWSFGDGTTSNLLCARKSYTYPGQYTVNLFVYDCYGNVRVSSFSQTVTIHDIFPLTFNIGLSSGYNVLSSYTGQISGPLNINATYPIYQKPVDIYYKINGSGSDYYQISSNKFGHLEKYSSMYQKVYNYYLSSYQYEEIDRIVPSIDKIFGKLTDDGIVTCPSTDSNSFFIGISGHKEIYFKFDVAELNTIKFNFDKTQIYSPFVYDDEYVSYFNLLGITLSAICTENVGYSALSITSNGMHGEGYPISSFYISPIKFENVKIPFLVKVIDQFGFSTKSISNSNFSFSILSGNNVPINSYYYELSSLDSTLSAFDHSGSKRYYIKFRNISNILSSVKISSVGIITPEINSGLSINTFGSSSVFDVYKNQYYDIYKKNENFDAEQTYKDLRFQEFLLDKDVLFSDYIGTIVGGISSNHESLGKKIYEKISNFVENNADIDRSEIYSLLSQMNMLGADVNIYDSTLMNYPEQIKRILNLASINRNKLIGTSNKFKENFDLKGHTQKNEFGINLGTQINTDTYIITAGTPIVALEKFSGDYTLLNTFQPLCALSSITYKLSAYSTDWGWPLVLPSDFVYLDFPKYYTFFEYIDEYDNRNSDFTIDFSNSMTTVLSTVSHNELFRRNGIFENMISNTLYSSLSLFDV